MAEGIVAHWGLVLMHTSQQTGPFERGRRLRIVQGSCTKSHRISDVVLMGAALAAASFGIRTRRRIMDGDLE